MKLELNIPESLDDITLQQYQKYLKIEEPTNDDLLTIFLDLDINTVNNIKDSEIDRLVVHINSLFEQEQQHILKFNLDSVRYGFIPDIDNITYGENKDITSYINEWETMHKAMSVLYRPIEHSNKTKYLIKEYNGTREVSEVMKQMPLSVVFGSMVFFYNLTNELLKAIPSYLNKELMMEQTKGVISVENGEAIKKYIHSLKKELQGLSELREVHQSLNIRYTAA